jgi:hypothetical protein
VTQGTPEPLNGYFGGAGPSRPNAGLIDSSLGLVGEVLQMVSAAHTIAASLYIYDIGSKDINFLTQAERRTMNFAGYVLESNVFAPQGYAWRNTWTDEGIDEIIKVNGPEWIVPGYTSGSQGNPHLVARMNGK